MRWWVLSLDECWMQFQISTLTLLFGFFRYFFTYFFWFLYLFFCENYSKTTIKNQFRPVDSELIWWTKKNIFLQNLPAIDIFVGELKNIYLAAADCRVSWVNRWNFDFTFLQDYHYYDDDWKLLWDSWKIFRIFQIM